MENLMIERPESVEAVEAAEAQQIHSLTAADFDELLAEARAEFEKRKEPTASLGQMLGEFQALDGYPGIYVRDMCLETEIRAVELYEVTDDTTPSGTLRAAVGIASLLLYRLTLPEDEAEARTKILGYARGTVDEEELFRPLTEREVGRMFKNSDDLNDVLAAAGMKFKSKGDEEESPNP